MMDAPDTIVAEIGQHVHQGQSIVPKEIIFMPFGVSRESRFIINILGFSTVFGH